LFRHHRLFALVLLALGGCTCDPLLASARTLTLTTVGEGTVGYSPSPLKQATDGRLYFQAGSKVTLTATPADGSFFESWDGACTGTDPTCEIPLNKDLQVTARFGVTIDLTLEGQGHVTSSPTGLDCTQSCKKAFSYDVPVTLGAVATAGYRFDGFTGDCSGMSCTLTTDAPHAVTAHFAAAPLPCDWVKRFGGPNRDNFGGVKRDAATGRIAIAGSTQGPIDFGGGQFPLIASGAAFVAVLDASGAYQSAFLRGKSGSVTLGDGIAWLPNGNLAVTGAWSGSIDFGDGVLRPDDANRFGLFRGFFAIWEPQGALIGMQPLGETTVLLSGFSAVSANPATGGASVVGTFAADASFGGPAMLSPQDFDGFTAQYDADGGFRWVQGGGGTSYDQTFAVHSTPDGKTLAAGVLSGAATFAGTTLDAGQTTAAFVLTWSSDGGLLGSDFLIPLDADGGSSSEAHAVSAFSSGDAVIGGWYSGQLMSSGAPTPIANGSPGADGFVARLGSQGWFVRLGGTMFDEVAAVAVDPSNDDVWVLGDFRGTINLNGTPQTSAGGSDLFLARYSKTGTLISVRYFGGPGDEYARGLQVDPFGRVLIAGEFENTVNFGVGNLTSAGDIDVFLGCFAP
jgi:hypothetical protein